MKDLILYGAGYPNVIKLINAINRAKKKWHILGFIDDTSKKQKTWFMDYPILGSKEAIGQINKKDTYFFNNVFSTMANRQKVSDILAQKSCKLATLVHPKVNTQFVTIGEDTIISEGAVLGANVTIGSHVAIRDLSVVNHDCRIDDCVFLAAGVTLCGYVTIATGAYIGAGSMIKERITIGEHSIVGAGSVVVKDIPSGKTVKGVAAK